MMVQMGIHHHLLSGSDISGRIGDEEATKPAKGRSTDTSHRTVWDDDDDWDNDDDFGK